MAIIVIVIIALVIFILKQRKKSKEWEQSKDQVISQLFAGYTAARRFGEAFPCDIIISNYVFVYSLKGLEGRLGFSGYLAVRIKAMEDQLSKIEMSAKQDGFEFFTHNGRTFCQLPVRTAVPKSAINEVLNTIKNMINREYPADGVTVEKGSLFCSVG